MVISSIVKRLGIIAIILMAALLAYGLIDANGYRAGYKAGYGNMGRLIDAACVNGLVLDAEMCKKADAALHPVVLNTVMGLASVSANLIPSVTIADQQASTEIAVVSRPKKIRKARKATISMPSKEDIFSVAPVVETTITPIAELGVPIQPTAPVFSPAETQIRAVITKAKDLSPTYCSEKISRECGSDFNCSINIATAACDFKNAVKGERAITDDQISQSMPCLTRDAIDRLGGVGTFVQGLQSAVCANVATGKFFFTSMPSDVRPLAELNYVDSKLKAFVNAYGVTAAAITQTIAPPLCSSVMSSWRQGQPMPTCTPDMMNMPMPSCPSNHWNNGACVSAIYIPSTLAQLISIIVGLFNH